MNFLVTEVNVRGQTYHSEQDTIIINKRKNCWGGGGVSDFFLYW